MKRWLVRTSLVVLTAAAASLPYGCGTTKSSGASASGGAPAGGEGNTPMGGVATVGGESGSDSVLPCASDKVCVDSGRLCDTERSVCVSCREDADCGTEELCVLAECVGYTPCEDSRQCSTDQVCYEAAGVCVECVTDSDCADGGVCAGTRCHASCESDKACVSDDQLCDEANGYCVDCVKDADCGNNAYCESALCLPAVCEPGERVCLGTALLTCDAQGRGYNSQECPEGCSDAAGGHCTGEAVGGAGGGGAAAGVGGEGGGSSEPCADTSSDPANCGACGYACVHGRECVSGRCTPAWQPLVTDGAPTPRTRHAAGFVAGRYVVLGGSLTDQGLGLDTVAGYDVDADVWATLAALNSARCSHEAVSTGAEILTFGGLSDCGNGGTTGPGLERFTPNAFFGSWSVIDAANAPGPRYNFAATWTGTALLIYGGGTNALPAVATGALFSPAGPSWSDASCALQGCERGGTFSMFTDGELVRLWGGGPFGNAPAGLSYNLAQESWSAWPVPAGTATQLAQRFADDGRRLYFLKATDVVTIYDRLSGSWLANDTAAMPQGLCTEAATAWTGTELVAWSGNCGSGPVNVGGRYQPPALN